MKVLTGIDIIEISRIKDSIEKLGDTFKGQIYTKEEIYYCESKKGAKYQHYAARFAAKEAVFKALSELLNNKYDMSWKDAEIINDEKGKPRINILKEEISNRIQSIDISISHCKEYATANVVLIID